MLPTALFLAAQYFPWIRENWEDLFPTQLPGAYPVNSNFIIPYLNKYSLLYPPEGMIMEWVAYSDAEKVGKDGMWSFVQMEITFPPEKRTFAESLLDTFTDQQKLLKEN